MTQQHKERIIQDFGNKQSTYYTEGYRKQSPHNYQRRLRQELISRELEKITNCDDVLDVGCGPAVLYPELLARCSRYHALDLVQTNLDKIRQEHPDANIDYILSDVDEFRADYGSYNIVVCSGALEYTTNPEQNLAKLIGQTKPGGTLIASFPNRSSIVGLFSEYVYKYLWYWKKRLAGQPAILYPRRSLTVTTLSAVCDKCAGVRSVDIRRFGFKLLPQPLDRLTAALDRAIDDYLGDKPAGLLATQCTETLVVVRKE